MATKKAIQKVIWREHGTWPEFLAVAFGIAESTVRGHLSELKEDGLVDSVETPFRRDIYFLTRLGAKGYSQNRKFSEPGYYKAAITRKLYATQCYAFERVATKNGEPVLGVPVRERVSRPRLKELWPGIAAGLPNNVEVRMARDKKPRLETMSVVGGTVKTAVRKAWERFEIRWFYESPREAAKKKRYPIRDLMRVGQLVDVLIVPTAEFKHAVEQELERKAERRQEAYDLAKSKYHELLKERNGKMSGGQQAAAEVLKRANRELGDAKAKWLELDNMGASAEELKAADEAVKVKTMAVKDAEQRVATRRWELSREGKNQSGEELKKSQERFEWAKRQRSLFEDFRRQLVVVVCPPLGDV